MERAENDEKRTFTVRQSSPQRQQPSNGTAEPIISLRIPASTLLEVGDSSEFLLDTTEAASSGASVFRKSHDIGEQDEELNVRTEPTATRIYKQHEGKELLHIGESSKRITIKPTREVQELGKRAREKLEQEKRKRKEIVRLEQDPSDNSKKAGMAFAEAIRKQRPRPTSIKRHSEKFSDSFPQSSTGIVDDWSPNISHVVTCAEGERSSVIRLHGLPKSVKPESIRDFFSGLDVERIFVLVPHDNRIREWDELRNTTLKPTVERHDPTFRVYVKFSSSPVADMALARSQEYLYVAGRDDDESKVGARIAMTKVPKSVANYLQHNLAIDGVTGHALGDTLSTESARLGKQVSNFVWTMASQDLNLSSPIEYTSLDKGNFEWQHDLSRLQPSIFLEDYSKLARHHNTLRDEYLIMEHSRVSLDMKEWDSSSYASDAIMRIKRAASDRILQEIECVKQMMYQVRERRRREA